MGDRQRHAVGAAAARIDKSHMAVRAIVQRWEVVTAGNHAGIDNLATDEGSISARNSAPYSAAALAGSRS